MVKSKTEHPLQRAGRMAKAIAAEMLWPTRCAVCDQPGLLLCDSCRRELPFIDATLACARCGAPYGIIQCSECNEATLMRARRSDLPFDGMASALLADTSVVRIVKTYKDKSERRLRSFIASVAARYVSPDWQAKTLAVSYIPDTRKARRTRGFDHGRELAQCLAQTLDCPCADLFSEPTSTDQRALNRADRFANMAKSIHLKDKAEIPPRVLLFDDVCTTGATLYAAADALRCAGVSELYALTLCRVLA